MSLKKHISELIKQNGGMISVATFMNEALANPKYGYYQTKNPFGTDGDFTTAPEISQMFGELIGAWIASVWQGLGSPKNINIVEIGAGRGTLMMDALRATKNIADFHKNVNICIVDSSKRLQKVQKDTLKDFEHLNIKWFENLEDVMGNMCIFVANELFDALPIYQYVKTKKGWQERCVAINKDDEFEFILSPLVLNLDEFDGKNIKENSIVEVCPLMENMVKQISQNIKKHGGAGLFIDYGYVDAPYKSTLQAVKKHQYHDCLKDVGDADLTYLIDFNKIAKIANNSEIQTSDVATQGDFLHYFGIEQRMNSLLKSANEKQKKDLISSYHRLTDKDKMGELFKVISLF